MHEVTDDRVWTVWGWCSRSYLRHGKRLAFPKHTDPVNTYQWRHVRAIASKIAEWGLDDNTAIKYIDTAVDYARQHNMLNKGLSVLHQSNMLELCFERIAHKHEAADDTVSVIRSMNEWLEAEAGENRLGALLRRPKPAGYTNITMWYLAHKLSPLFLAISKSCTAALMHLARRDKSEREMLPSKIDLYKLRLGVSDDNKLYTELCAILGSDWRV